MIGFFLENFCKLPLEFWFITTSSQLISYSFCLNISIESELKVLLYIKVVSYSDLAIEGNGTKDKLGNGQKYQF